VRCFKNSNDNINQINWTRSQLMGMNPNPGNPMEQNMYDQQEARLSAVMGQHFAMR
jgi:hypothetical protein